MDIMDVSVLIIQFLFVLGIFSLIVYAGNCILKKLKSTSSIKDSKFLKPIEYFPQEQLSSLKQLYYLMMILIFIIIDLYLLFGWADSLNYIFILDVLISAYLVLNMEVNSFKDKIILFLLIPVGSITAIFFGENLLCLFDLIHIFGYIYFIEVYYRKFVKYTENNGLGITIILLFSIILVSFLFTMFVEGVSPFDSIVMVSNAFTSNSFDAAGKTVVGKLDSLILAWSGFILSGVGTATLAVSMVRRHVNKKFDDLEKLIKSKRR